MNIQKELIKYQSEVARRFKPKIQDYNKPEMTRGLFLQKSRNEWSKIKKMPYGKERRKAIIEWCGTQSEQLCWLVPFGFRVNCEGSLIVKKDKDLQYLIKKKILMQINNKLTLNIFTGRQSSANYLVLSDKYSNLGLLK